MSFINTQVFVVVAYMVQKCNTAIAIKENLEYEKWVVDEV